jgi:alkanesulfonate monooxygenase SsuD/methylene tetrahydromethanopterin reductase-like flavin-dependent oxidoreductase (luciferase family)
MTDSPPQPAQRPTGVLIAVKSAVDGVVLAVRRVIGLIVSVLARDSLSSLRLETERLGSNAVESATYVGLELRSIDERLARLEEELAALRQLLEQRATVGERSSD